MSVRNSRYTVEENGFLCRKIYYINETPESILQEVFNRYDPKNKAHKCIYDFLDRIVLHQLWDCTPASNDMKNFIKTKINSGKKYESEKAIYSTISSYYNELATKY